MADDRKAVIEDGANNDLGEFAGWEQHGGELTKLEIGQAVRGKFKGSTSFETNDSRTGELKQVLIHSVEQPSGAVIRLLGVTMLDAAFAKEVKPGTSVYIRRNKDRKSSRNRPVHDYTILTPKS
jgi:hypothetical protein